MFKRLFLGWILTCMLLSCGSVKDIAYLQGGDSLFDKMAVTDTFEMKIRKNDILDIVVSCADPILLTPFNINSVGYGTGYSGSTGANRGYLVEADGTINFPLLGKIRVVGLSRRSLRDFIQDGLIQGGYIKDPVVTVRFLNFRIMVLGEVARPGTFNITSERVTLFEALSLAGDLTIYGRRSRVAVIREQEGVRTILYHDLRSRDVFKSPDYYLQQNDMVYVEPNRVKAEASTQNQFTSLGTWVSFASFVMSVCVLIFK